MTLRTLIWLGIVLGVMSAGLVVLYQIQGDPTRTKGSYYYGGIVHKWVWVWVIALLLAMVLWAADVIPGRWVWMVFFGLIAFVAWAFVLQIFWKPIGAVLIWGEEKTLEYEFSP